MALRCIAKASLFPKVGSGGAAHFQCLEKRPANFSNPWKFPAQQVVAVESRADEFRDL